VRIHPAIRLNKDKQTFLAMSDIHFGSKRFMKKEFLEYLEEAKEREARVLLIGDIFDAVYPFGDKRYNPSILAPEFQGRDDLPLYAVQKFAELIAPYCDLIDLYGLGNHEVALWRHNGINLVGLLRMLLKQQGKYVGFEGGYMGYMFYIFELSRKKCRRVNILYHHGTGTSAVVTKGMIDINRALQYPWHVFLFGHKHFKIADASHLIQVVPGVREEEGFIYYDDRRAFQVGSFVEPKRVEKTGEIPPYDDYSGVMSLRSYGAVFFTVSITRIHRTINGKVRDFETVRIRGEI